MAKFGLFYGNNTTPSQTFEGDYMVRNNEFVTVFKMVEGMKTNQDNVVAAIRLEGNANCVKKISD